jgi:hypothetical protein
MPLIQKIVNGQAEIIDPAPAVVRQVMRLLSTGASRQEQPSTIGNEGPAAHKFYATGQPRTFSFDKKEMRSDFKQAISFEKVDV